MLPEGSLTCEAQPVLALVCSDSWLVFDVVGADILQVRDTVELFSFRRQRKLSLRFLASYLLGLSIQTGAGAAGAAAATAAAAATSKASAGDTAAKQGTMLVTAAAVGHSGTLAAAAVAKVGPGVSSAAAAASSGGNQGHDSIEDAATALALYKVYCTLKVGACLKVSPAYLPPVFVLAACAQCILQCK